MLLKLWHPRQRPRQNVRTSSWVTLAVAHNDHTSVQGVACQTNNRKPFKTVRVDETVLWQRHDVQDFPSLATNDEMRADSPVIGRNDGQGARALQ